MDDKLTQNSQTPSQTYCLICLAVQKSCGILDHKAEVTRGYKVHYNQARSRFLICGDSIHEMLEKYQGRITPDQAVKLIKADLAKRGKHPSARNWK